MTNSHTISLDVTNGPGPSDIDETHVGKEQEQKELYDQEKTGAILPYAEDAFGNEEFAEVKYKVLSWWYGSYSLLSFLLF